MEQLMPIGFELQPRLMKFTIAKIRKELTESQLKLYKQKYADYFNEYDYLKLVKSEKNDLNYVLMLFCRPEDLEEMKQGFQVEEFVELELPCVAPIDKRQKQIYDKYWNVLHPMYEYPSKQFKLAPQLMKHLTETKQSRNKCLLYDEFKKQIIAEAEDETETNPLQHCVMVIMGKLAEINKNNDLQFHQKQYFAKDLVLITYIEPCIMCAMALVHSRIGSVYYRELREKRGGLNQKMQINNNKSLNHRYYVFRTIGQLE